MKLLAPATKRGACPPSHPLPQLPFAHKYLYACICFPCLLAAFAHISGKNYISGGKQMMDGYADHMTNAVGAVADGAKGLAQGAISAKRQVVGGAVDVIGASVSGKRQAVEGTIGLIRTLYTLLACVLACRCSPMC